MQILLSFPRLTWPTTKHKRSRQLGTLWLQFTDLTKLVFVTKGARNKLTLYDAKKIEPHWRTLQRGHHSEEQHEKVDSLTCCTLEYHPCAETCKSAQHSTVRTLSRLEKTTTNDQRQGTPSPVLQQARLPAREGIKSGWAWGKNKRRAACGHQDLLMKSLWFKLGETSSFG